jgi:hypothetical protein
MRFHVRFSLLALVVGATVAVSAPAAQAAFGVEKFVAVNCSEGHEECAEEKVGLGPFFVPKEPTKEEAEEQGYLQAAGHVPFGITDFKVNTEGSLETGEAKPQGAPVTHIRTDVPPGLATSPVAAPQCTMEEFGDKEVAPGTNVFPKPKCTNPDSTIGVNKVIVYIEAAKKDVPLEGTVYNLVPREGIPLEFGVAIDLAPLGKAGLFSHTLIEGTVEWGQETRGTNQGDYHDYFEINVSPTLPLVRSRLVFFGNSPKKEGDLITNASRCPGSTTTILSLTNSESPLPATRSYTTPVGLTGCNKVPFEPIFSLSPATSGHDEPDGFTTEVGLTRHPKEEIDSAQLKTAVVKLPEGMTLNPSAAAGLSACTPAQARIHSSTPGVACPASSELGTVTIDVPTLPPGSLTGKIYLGGPESGPITGPPYVVYLDAESARYGVSVRIKGETFANEQTGQLTTVFNENPEQPFTNAIMHFKEGALAPIANPLSCGTAATQASFFPFTEVSAKALESAFTVTGCPSPLPFALTQSTQNQTGTAGGHTSFTLNLTRKEGEQYLSQVRTVLPAGLLAALPTVTPCTEAQAVTNTCPAASQIGAAVAVAGSGPTPFTFANGTVYLTGPYNGAPYGLSIVVPAVAGPFNLGPVITRAMINVEPYSGRVIVTSFVPNIVKGIPIRLRSVTVAINKQGYLFNPTSCGPLATDSTLTSTFNATEKVSSPLQLTGCNKLAFKPSFRATTTAKTSKANGASLETTIDQPAGQANLKSVKVTLPKALPSRLTTLQQACPAATFEANPYICPKGSFVGGARANTPTLPSKMQGPAILVSHAAAKFPDLDLVLEANGFRIIVVGNTDIKKGITTTTFAATPDAPVPSVTVNLPIGPHSALAANTNLCAHPLTMPTVITGQNGTVIKQNTKIRVTGCPVRISGHKTAGNTAYLTVQTYGAGRISGSGSGLSTVYRHFKGAVKSASLKVPLSRGGRGRGKPFSTRVRVGFVPKKKGPTSVAHVTVTFR